MKDNNGFSDEISNRSQAVSEVAFLANLLTLEASIEAAGAGESTCEFLQIAEEVHALAQRGAHAAARTL